MTQTAKVTPDTRHLTASMVVVDPFRGKVLLIHHNATGLWMVPGGHVGDEDNPNEAPHEAAIREVLEETGVKPEIDREWFSLPGMTVQPRPIVVAEMPAPLKPERPNKAEEPAHSHIDMLYLGKADSTAPLTHQPEEVGGAQWFTRAEVETMHHAQETRAEVLRVTYMCML